MLIQNQMRLSMVHFRTNENDKCVVFVREITLKTLS